MSCGRITVPGYEKLVDYIAKQHGDNNQDYNTLLSFIEDDYFKNVLKERGINPKKAYKQAYKALVEARLNAMKKLADFEKQLDKKDAGNFTSIRAREQAVDYLAAKIANSAYYYNYRGELVTTDDLIKYAKKNVVKQANNLIEELLNNDTTGKIAEEIKARITDAPKNMKVIGYAYILRKYGTFQHFNYGMLLVSLTSSAFMNDVFNRKNVAKISRNINYQFNDFEELGQYIDELEEASDEYGQSEDKDSMTELWNLGIGEKRNFSDHVDALIKYHLSTIPVLNDTSTKDGYNINTDNELGVETFMDSDYLIRLIYSKADTSNRNNFLASIKEIAESVEGAEGLIKLYDLLYKDNNLLNKYMMVFNKPIISKVETYVRNGVLHARVTNPNTNVRSIVKNHLIASLKDNLQKNNLSEAVEAYNEYTKYIKNKNFDKTTAVEMLYSAFEKLISGVDRRSFIKMADAIKNETGDDYLSYLQSFVTNLEAAVRNTVNNYNNYLNSVEEAKQKRQEIPNKPESFINTGDMAIIEQLATRLYKFMPVTVELNSRNVEGNLSSDVINRSYITNILDIINNDNSASSYANQKFTSRQYDFSNILLEHTDNSGKIINYGLFRQVGNTYVITEYARDMFNLELFNGISNLDNWINALYSSMSDGDYLLSALGAFVNDKDVKGMKVGRYLLPTPSDAPKNFFISAPKYDLTGIRYEVDGQRVINKKHQVFQQFYNIAIQELTNMAHAINKMFECDAKGKPIQDNFGNFIFSKEYLANPDAFYVGYFKNPSKDDITQGNAEKGNPLTRRNGHFELNGNIFRFNRIKSEATPNSNNKLNSILGYGKEIDFLYGGSNTGVSFVNGKIKLNAEQQTSVENAVAEWLTDYLENSYKLINDKYGAFTEDTVNNAQIVEFLVNNYLVLDSMYDMFGGDQAFYKSSQDILKRIKEIQASGSPFGITDLSINDMSENQKLYDIKFDNNPITVSYHDKNGNVITKTVEQTTKFTAVTVANTEKTADVETVKNLVDMLKRANVSKKDIDRIIAPFKDNKTTANDAQSYITLEEWIRRITAAGELEKYGTLIDALTDSTPVEEIDWQSYANFVQIQKNFYYDLHYDQTTGIEVPRQIKNAEFVLIPKLIAGTELEKVYDVMMRNGINQINTVETVKAAKHNTMTLWNNEGELTDDNLETFENEVKAKSEEFSYNYLYRQQEVPQHLVDAENKAAIQIMKKIMDNLDTTKYSELGKYRQNIFDAYVGNITESFISTCKELGIELDKNNKIVLDENGEINLNKAVFFARFKENAAAQGVDKALLEFFELDEFGNPNLPTFLANISSKLESIANSFFNSSITRQTISGWHAAQLSDFGFNKLSDGKVRKDRKLKYKVNDNGVHVVEIRLPAWSKQLYDEDGNLMDINDIPDEIKTMIGYRIPTEGKQSVCIFKVVEILPEAYGSTVVVPDEWVTQTGSDFDVDSIYAMTRTFRRTKNGLQVIRAYDNTEAGYIEYLKAHSDRAAKAVLGKNYRGGVLNEALRNEEDQINARLDGFDGNLAVAEQIAENAGLPFYETYKTLSENERMSKAARANVIIDNFINILNHPGAFEENATTSNFDNLRKSNKKYGDLKGVTETIVAPSDFITQLRWFDSATSGIKLKGISVNRDSFMSISNVAKGIHTQGIKVLMDGKTLSEKDAIKRFGEDNVTPIAQGTYWLTLNKFGWSNDNKNIDGYLINPYSSQTTAHILDVMKEGAVYNENTYTFNAFKTIVDLGANYDLAVAFMHQPAMDIIVRKWKETNSINSEGKRNAITEALREIMAESGFKVEGLNRKQLIDKFDSSKLGNLFKERYNLSLSDAFSGSGIMFSLSEFESRLESKQNSLSDRLSDIATIGRFYYLDSIGTDVSNNLNILTADKYGAKQSFFATNQIFVNAPIYANDSKIVIDTSSTGGQTQSLLESVFPGIKNGLNSYTQSDISKSVYPSLAAFLQMSSALSLKASEQVFETANPVFVNYISAIDAYTRSGKISEQLYNSFKNYVINRQLVTADATTFITNPITIIDGVVTHPKDAIENTGLSRSIEAGRISGLYRPINLNDFNVENINNIKQKEIDNFAKLTPAQKIIWIKNNMDITDTIFEFINPNVTDERDANDVQYINFDQDNRNNNDIHRMFSIAWNSSNPLIKLATIDLVKYSIIFENQTFRTRNVTRALSNDYLYSSLQGGFDMAINAKNAIRGVGYENLNESAIGYIRQNLNNFDTVTIRYKNASKNHIKINYTQSNVYGPVTVEGTGLENMGIYNSSNNQWSKTLKIVRDDITTIYIFDDTNGRPTYYPLGKLEKFETFNSLGNSIVRKNNRGNSLVENFNREQESVVDHNKVVDGNLEYIKPYTNGEKTALELNKKPIGKVVVDYDSKLEHGAIYKYEDTNYLSLRGEAAYNYNKAIKEFKTKYTGYDISKAGVLIELEERDFDRVADNQTIHYSSIPNPNTLGRALKSSMGIIANGVSVNNEEARKALNSMRTAEINHLDSNALVANSDLASNVVDKFVTAETEAIMKDINYFININGEEVAIDDDEVITRVLQDETLQNRFLDVLANVYTFRNKYKQYNDIDLETLSPETRKHVKTITELVNKIDTNQKVKNARNKWLKRYIQLNSTNPNVISGLMNELDAYGDMGFVDFWIQDTRANRNIVVQTILKEVATKVEEGRIQGLLKAKEFENTIKNIINEATKSGKNVSINDVIDNNGRLIQTNTVEWENEINRLEKSINEALGKFGENSIEHLRSKNNKAAFIAKTTVHKYLPVSITNEAGEVSTIDYDNALIAAENRILQNSGAPETYSKYKKIQKQISEIINRNVDNNLSLADEQLLNELYSQIDSLTSYRWEDGEAKTGEDLHNAEELNQYISTNRFVKELFLNKVEKDGFQAKLKEVLSVINKYKDKKDSNGNPLIHQDDLMKYEDYAEARNWLRNNTQYVLSNEDFETFNWAYDILNDPSHVKGPTSQALKVFKDEYGRVDARKIPAATIANIKEQTFKNFKYTKHNGLPYAGIIRAVNNDTNVYSREFYQNITGNAIKTTDEITYGEAINLILEKYYDASTKTLKTYEISEEDLTSRPPVEGEPKNLLELFTAFNNLTKGKSDPDVAARISKFIQEECDVTYDMAAWESDRMLAKTLHGERYLALWDSVFSQMENGKLIPNTIIYGTIKPKDVNKWLDAERTEARRILTSRTREITSEYFFDEYRRIKQEEGEDAAKEWYKNNTYYDPYSRTFKPLKVWTFTQYLSENGDDIAGQFVPRINQMDINPKEELINPEYNKSGINKYKLGTGYDNSEYTKLNDYQLRIMNEVKNILQQYVYTNSNQRYVDQGWLPTLPKAGAVDYKDIPKEVAAFFGWSANTPTNTAWKNNEDLTFDKDYVVPNPQLSHLVNSQTQKHVDVPKFKDKDESDEAFAKRKQEAINTNLKITEENNKVRQDIINKNWDEVLRSFIVNGGRYNAIQTVKNLLYTADQIVSNNPAYQMRFGKPAMNKRTSTDNDIEYYTEEQKYTSEQLRGYIRRLLFEQYKKPTSNFFAKLGSMAQNVAGSKYMMLNLTGGIANVMTGSANIAMEYFAEQYIDKKSWLKGGSEYFKGTLSYMAGMYSSDASTLQDGLIKLSNVVDFDRIIDITGIDGVREQVNRLRGLLFSPQSVGEHYMQNRMLFAMMDYHRLIPNKEGNGYVIKSREENRRDAEKLALTKVIENDEKLLEAWNEFTKANRKDEVVKAKYNLFKEDEANNFVLRYLNSVQQKQYLKVKEKLENEANKKFDTEYQKVFDQFELRDGIAQIKADSNLTYREFAGFVDKVKEVNKKVHGVYDKLGSAKLENEWFGGFVMQYHKHIHPAIKKRYRYNGYYNETLKTVEKGSYYSLYQFLAMPFNSAVDEYRINKDLIGALKNLGKNILSFQTRITQYQLLPEYERANIRRNLGDTLALVTAVVGAIAISGLGGDDDDSIGYNLALYMADRLATESAAFTPLGVFSEFDKLWSSPVAILQTYNDIRSTLNFTYGMLLEDGFDTEYTTGRYKGHNKFEVMLFRNIPVVRSINRIMEMPQNNSYYKVNENILSIIPTKDIAESIFD